MDAFGTAAAEGSTTVPRMLPVICCAAAVIPVSRIKTNKREHFSTREYLFTRPPQEFHPGHTRAHVRLGTSNRVQGMLRFSGIPKIHRMMSSGTLTESRRNAQ